MNAGIPVSFSPITLAGLPANSNILVAEAWDVSPHLETGLEVALRLASAYQKVAYCHYGRILPVCECVPDLQTRLKRVLLRHGHSSVATGIKLAEQFARFNSLPFEVVSPSVEATSAEHSIEEGHLESVEDLKLARFKSSSALGISVASSLISITRNSEATPGEHADLINKLATSFARSFYVVDGLAKASTYDALVIFNGRFSTVKGAALAAQQLGIPVYYHERGCSKDSFSLRIYQPHDRMKVQEDICNSWKISEETSAKSIARNYFFSKRAGKDKAWISFNDRMIPGQAHAMIQAAKARSRTGIVISFFSSSDDEYISVSDTFTQSAFEWNSQDEAFKVLAESVRRHGHGLVVRNHPHLRTKARSDRLKWDHLSFINDKSNILLLESGCSVDTYELIEMSDLVVTYGSTVGIEAVFWGRTSITLSDCFYDEIGASVYKPLTVSELDELIANTSRLSTNPSSSFPYGYYQSTFGTSFQLYQPKTLFKGQFLGEDLWKETRRQRVASAARKLLSRTKETNRERS